MRRAKITFSVSIAAALAALAMGYGCGSDAALVGGACAAGFTECDLRCVDLMTDPANCGACAHACAAGATCASGACTTEPGDATVRDAPGDGIAPSDASDATIADADADATRDGEPDAPADAESDALPDAPSDAQPDVGSDAGTDACTPPYDNVEHCGDCQTRCTAPNDACKPTDGGFACVPLCDPPMSNCGGVCVDTSTDPANCGVCGKYCVSHLCASGACQGTTPGDVVVIGHDYAAAPINTAQSRLLANAVFIPGSNPLRIMTYERWSDAAAVANVKAILGARAALLGRTLAFTVTTSDADVPSRLDPTAFDVLLVPDQPRAPAGSLTTLGSSWSAAAGQFASRGGVVVLLDGADGVAEMPALATSAGLMAITSHATLAARTAVNVTAPADVVGVGVLSPYGVWDHTATLEISPAPRISFVVQTGDASQSPIVVHRVVAP